MHGVNVMSTIEVRPQKDEPLLDQVLSDIILQIYDSALNPNQFQDFLARLRTVFDAKYSHFVLLDTQTTSLPISVISGVDHDLFRQIYGRPSDRSQDLAIERWTEHFVSLMPSDPRVDYLQRFPSKAFSCRRVIAEDALYASKMYQEILDPLDAEYSLVVGAPAVKDTIFALGVFRGKAGRAFSDREVERFSLLMPHVKKAHELGAALDQLRADRELARAGLEALPIGVALFTADGQLDFANSTARELIADHSDVSIGSGTLQLRQTQESLRLQRALADALQPQGRQASAQFTLGAPGRPDGASLSISVAPLSRISTSGFYLQDAPAAIMLISDPGRAIETPSEHIQRLLGLTEAESRVVIALARGSSVKTIAQAASLSEHTVRNQLKSAFQKTNTSSQTDLVRYVLQLPTLRSAPDRL